jgi:predicted nucleotidyltransferase
VEKNQLPDFLEILKILTKHKVDFIVVGGVCAVLHGAPVTTFDLDLVHSRSSQNLASLMSALNELDAYYRGRGDQRLKPKRSHLSSPGHQLLMTKAGPLDLLGTIGVGHSYKDLLEHTVELEAGGLHLHILNLEKLIEIKKETITDKDKAMLPILQHTLEEKQNSDS